MPRKHLKEARQLAGFTQEQFAAILKVNPGTVTGWETQDNTIRPCSIKPIKDVLGDDPHLFAIEKADKVEPVEATDEERSTGPLALPQNDTGLSVQEPCHVPVVSDRVDSSDSITIHIPGSVRGIRAFMELVRRQFMALAGKASGGFLFSGLTVGLVPSAAVDPEEYLSLCSESVDRWWEWLSEGRDQRVERALSKNVPVLKRLAYTASPFQELAASLAVQAKIMQICLACRNLDFVESEIHCAEAIRFGAISGDRDTLAAALAWQGNAYTVCYHRPQTAIPILHDALSYLGSGPSVMRSSIYSNLSLAYAQDDTQDDFEKKTRDYVELAHSAMPAHPELDPLYQSFLRWDHSVLKSLEGKASLYLARHFPNSDYAQKAYAVLDVPASSGTREGVRGGALIKKADAACALGDMREFVGCLEQGLSVSGTIRRMSEASDVMGRIPDVWQHETAVQNLQKEVSHALVIARR